MSNKQWHTRMYVPMGADPSGSGAPKELGMHAFIECVYYDIRQQWVR